ncbi:hypothetical protein PG996_006864 [Apiospora saccharicola]|uniref:Uncharacterized protein n=1 Tax=Apiospora saccharicola TaxID=335842 RepID=A0ABR1V983_9PEZI
MDQILPGASSDNDGAYTACVQRFRARTRAPDRTYPLDLGSEYSDVLRAASLWSAELLGPPQYLPKEYGDLHEECLFVTLEGEETSYDRRQQDRLERVITDLNNEAMRFKVQLYELFRYSDLAKQIENEEQFHLLVGLVDELEERAMLLRPLEARLSQLWPIYVAFAKPRLQLLREQAEEEELNEPTEEERCEQELREWEEEAREIQEAKENGTW